MFFPVPCVCAREPIRPRLLLQPALACCIAATLCATAFAQTNSFLPIEPEEDLDLESPLAELPRPASPPRAPMTPVAVIVIDPGHGGNDAGATGPGGLAEETAVLSVAQRLQAALLETVPGQVLLTRNEDVDRTDAARVNYAKAQEAGLFISLHTGASYAPSAQGVEAFYHGPAEPADSGAGNDEAERVANSRRLAERLVEAVSLAVDAPVRGVHGVESRVLRNVPCPAVLIELGCVTNPGDEAKLSDESYHDRLAQGLAAGILQYIDPGRVVGEAP